MDAGSMTSWGREARFGGFKFFQRRCDQPSGIFPRLKAAGWEVCRATRQAKHAAGVLIRILYAARMQDFTYYGQSTAEPAVSQSGRRRIMLHCSG